MLNNETINDVFMVFAAKLLQLNFIIYIGNSAAVNVSITYWATSIWMHAMPNIKFFAD